MRSRNYEVFFFPFVSSTYLWNYYAVLAILLISSLGKAVYLSFAISQQCCISTFPAGPLWMKTTLLTSWEHSYLTSIPTFLLMD